MHRAAVAVVAGGLALGGTTGAASADGTRTQTVSYGGYEITVPASWPVYWLSRDPSRCVRYDTHAVYIGTPGTDQQCPPRAVGRTETVSISAPVRLQSAAVGSESTQPGVTGGEEVRQVPALHAAIMMNDASHQLSVSMSAPSDAVVTGTYGTDPGAVTQALATLRKAPQPSVAASRSTPPAAAPAHAAGGQAAQPGPVIRVAGNTDSVTSGGGKIVVKVEPTSVTLDGGNKPATAARSVTAAGPASARPAKAQPAKVTTAKVTTAKVTTAKVTTAKVTTAKAAAKQLPGFDTCTAPSLSAMRAWRAKYSVAGIYLGGSNMACDYGNLSASWVRSATAMGWGLLPVYVGLQAPCYGYGAMINAKRAAAQGQNAAKDAMSEATRFGLRAGSPIYYDMEAYNETKRSCVTAVLQFLSAWTKALNARGYTSGVYSSADSGVQNLQSAAVLRTVTEPQAIWFAQWDNKRNLTGAPVLGSRPWAISDRVKQYAGGHTQKIGKYSLNIDSDLVGGPVAR